MIPTFILQIWLLGLFSIGIIGLATFLAHEWQQRSWGWDQVLQQSVFVPQWGWNQATLMIAAAVLLALLALGGGRLVKLILRLLCRSEREGETDPRSSPKPASEQTLIRQDGSKLHVEFYGPTDGIPIVLTHGWSLNSKEWNYLKRELTPRFRLIVWDEAGLGGSTRPANRDYSLDNLASDLKAVLDLVGDKPAILLGHSIGGMITLTLCRLYPSLLGKQVAGLVLTHTTPTNPVRTTSGAAFYSLIEKPVLMPLMYLTIALSPLVWLMSWLSYLNGSAHLSSMRSSFAGTQSWKQIDFAARFQPHASPAVLARGMLGMMRYDAIPVLPTISVPVLIVAGDRDTVTKPEASELMRASIPGARLITLTPAKHLGLIEHHSQYAAAIVEFAHRATAQKFPRAESEILNS